MHFPLVTPSLCGLQWFLHSSWHCKVLQCYYELYSDRFLDGVNKLQVQKFATKQLQCRTDKSVSLWFNFSARKCNSPMTEEKEMVLTEFASQFHRLLSNKIAVFTF